MIRDEILFTKCLQQVKCIWITDTVLHLMTMNCSCLWADFVSVCWAYLCRMTEPNKVANLTVKPPASVLRYSGALSMQPLYSNILCYSVSKDRVQVDLVSVVEFSTRL